MHAACKHAAGVACILLLATSSEAFGPAVLLGVGTPRLRSRGLSAARPRLCARPDDGPVSRGERKVDLRQQQGPGGGEDQGERPARPARELSLGSETLQRYPKLFPKLLDSTLAGAGLAGAISLLCVLQGLLGVKLFAAPMMASGIIFFAAQKPPPPTGFIVGTLAGTTLCETMYLLLPGQLQYGAAAGALLIVYKLTNSMFPPAAVLAVLIAQDLQSPGVDLATPLAVAKYAAFPWLIGHGVLYGAALGMGEVRKRSRTWAMKGQLRGLSQDLSVATLRESFAKFDTSGDGYLDAEELRMALKVARGEQVPLEDCKELIAAVDSDGDGVVDFAEFCDICNAKYSL
jgi:hypothetical protein